MQRIAVIGLGKVGTLVATLLSENFSVTALDLRPAPAFYHCRRLGERRGILA